MRGGYLTHLLLTASVCLCQSNRILTPRRTALSDLAARVFPRRTS